MTLSTYRSPFSGEEGGVSHNPRWLGKGLSGKRWLGRRLTGKGSPGEGRFDKRPHSRGRFDRGLPNNGWFSRRPPSNGRFGESPCGGFRTLWLPLLLCLPLAGCAPDASDEPLKFRISIDTGPNHLRNATLRRFIEALDEAAPGQFDIRFYESGQLSNDRDVPKALHWGNIDMGVPAQSKMTRFLTDANLFTLPVLSGLPEDVIFALHDGPVGRELNRRIEEKLGVKVLGRSIPLGFTTTYTTDRVLNQAADMRGMKIRTPGGAGSLSLFQFYQANSITLPFADVPLALAQGSLDGIQSSHETVMSGQLWQVGLKYCYEDRANLLVYVPVLSNAFWGRLTPQAQERLTEVWEETVGESREYARGRQEAAKQVLMDNGVVCRRNDEAELATDMPGLTRLSDDLVRRLNMDPVLYQLMLSEVERLTAGGA